VGFRRDSRDQAGESYEAIRLWCRRFGPAFAAGLRRRRARAGDKWHLDEVPLKIKGKRYWLWRAVDQEGLVLDILVQDRRDQHVAERFLRRVVDGEDARPRVVVADKLASYPPTLKRVLPGVEHRRHTRLNTRAENSHRTLRKRERVLQRFLEPCSAVHNHFRPRCHPLVADRSRHLRTARFQQWREPRCLPPAA
jgi:putative transposase